MIHLPAVTPDEYAYLIRMLGGPSEQGTRTLGVGLSGEGVIALRAKFSAVAAEMTPDQAMVEIANGHAERICMPGKWSAYLHDGHPVVQYYEPA